MDKVLGKKIKMSQIWKGEKVIPVTIVKYEKPETDLPFKEGDKVKVSGNSKGRGFQGVVKRHGFHGGPKTHGQKNRHRAPGSIGNTTPQRVIPGRRMAGRMGGVKATTRGLKVVKVDVENNLIAVKGAVPGNKGGVLVIQTQEN